MKTATIYLENGGDQVYTGATAKAKTVKRAIKAAYDKTENAWNLPAYAKVDGARVNFDIFYDTEKGADDVIILSIIKDWEK